MTKRKPAPAGLSHDAIASAALELIDKDGLAAFSTRKLGRVLGCEAMAIYWYFASKDELLDAVVDRLIAGVGAAASAPTGDWVTTLRGVAHAYRGIAHRHPKAFPLLATRRFASDGTYAFMERLFELAAERGIDERAAARHYRIVSSYVNGFALNELAAPPRRGPARKRFARVAAAWEWLEPRHLDEIFEFGLELHLAALVRASA